MSVGNVCLSRMSVEYICLLSTSVCRYVCLSNTFFCPVCLNDVYVCEICLSVEYVSVCRCVCLSMCLSVDVSVCWIYLLSYTAYIPDFCQSSMSFKYVCIYDILSRMFIYRECLFVEYACFTESGSDPKSANIRKLLIVNFCYTIFQKYRFSETDFYSLFDKLLQLQNHFLQRNRLLTWSWLRFQRITTDPDRRTSFRSLRIRIQKTGENRGNFALFEYKGTTVSSFMYTYM